MTGERTSGESMAGRPLARRPLLSRWRMIPRSREKCDRLFARFYIPDAHFAIEAARRQSLRPGVIRRRDGPILMCGEGADFFQRLRFVLAHGLIGRAGKEMVAGKEQLVDFSAKRRFRRLLAIGDYPAMNLVVASAR